MKNLLHIKLIFLLVWSSLVAASAETVAPTGLPDTVVSTSTIGGPIDYGLE